jgi:hypothetical protein
MATINLGAIKFNWKGAYNSGTTYAVDDVVSSGGNSYVCIQAHSNQAVGNATAYWNIMSSAGTNGTDISTTLTTQGDILYRDGSGLQRLAKPSSDKILQNTSGGVLSYIDAPSGKVKQVVVASNTTGVTTSSHNMEQGGGTYAVGNVGTAHISVSITPLSSSSKLIISAAAPCGMGGNGQGYVGLFVDNVCRSVISANGYSADGAGMSITGYYNNTSTNAKTVQFRTLGCWGGHDCTLGTRRASGSARATTADGQYGNMIILEVE